MRALDPAGRTGPRGHFKHRRATARRRSVNIVRQVTLQRLGWLKLAGVAIGGALLLVAVIALVVKWGPDWLASTGGLSPADRAAETGRVRTALLAILAGGIAVVGAFYTAKTFALNRQGQITERFTRATDQLGSAQINVRLGGIYALERIARESAVDRPAITEILTGFLREHSRHRQAENSQAFPMPTDTQAALSVVTRLQLDYDSSQPVDLGGADLRHGNLQKTRLPGASFGNAKLGYADLRQADLRQASFAGVDLTSGQLQEANLSGAKFLAADLEWTQFEAANLQGADFFTATLYKTTNLTRADIRGANFLFADLTAADFSEATYDETTVWPDGFDPTASSVRSVPRSRESHAD